MSDPERRGGKPRALTPMDHQAIWVATHGAACHALDETLWRRIHWGSAATCPINPAESPNG